MPTTLLKNPVSVSATSTAVSLSVEGIAAAATPGAGTQPSNTLTVQGTTGQATTGTGQTAGAGANVAITAGTGGAAPPGSTRGAGGSVMINPGSPGIGAGTGGAYGKVLLATDGGNVGIGTTGPGKILHTCGTTGLKTEASTSTNAIHQTITNGGGNSFLGIASSAGTGLANGGLPYSLQLQTEGAYPLQLGTNNNVRITIDSSGNVGIGTTPSGVLDIARTGADIVVRSITTTSGISRLDVRGYGTSTSPAGNLHLSGAHILLANKNSTDGNYTTIFNQSNGGAQRSAICFINDVQATDASSIAFLTHNGSALAERVRFDTTGRVGIGTTTPGSKLHVNGGVQVGTPTGGDKGAGSINVSGEIYKNGTPLLEKLEEAYRTILDLTQRVDRLEGTLSGKPARSGKSRTPKKSSKSAKSRKSAKERR
jgi:hypothetical protein